MYVTEIATGTKHWVVIQSLKAGDYKKLSEDRYFFDWKKEKKYDVYKLRIVGSSDIIGLVSLESIDEELRVEIRLLTVSKENAGKKREYERIAGCLITYACKRAVMLYEEYACVSLKPKTRLKTHYQNAYGMMEAGERVCLLGGSLLNMIKNYDHE